jgi:hypothetical protein
MILFDHITQVFDLMDDDVGTVGLVVAGDGGFIGLTAVNGDDFGHPVTADRLRQKPQRRLGILVLCQQNVTGLPGCIHGAIQIAPLAFDPDVRLVHAPADPHRPLALVECLFQWGLYVRTQRLIVAWSTDTPRSAISASTCRSLKGTPHTSVRT